MSYLQKDKRRDVKRVPIFSVLFVLFLLLCIRFVAPGTFSRFFMQVSLPFWRGQELIVDKTSDFFSLFYFKRSLIKQIEELEARLVVAEVALNEKTLLQQENTDLKNELGIKKEKGTVVASVVLRPPQTFYDTFMLDRGSDDGVNVGDGVYAGDSVLLGKIVETSASISKAVLFSTSGEEISSVSARNNTPVNLVGLGAGNFSASVPRDVSIENGDLITYAGFSHLLVGVVGNVDASPNDSLKSILISTPVALNELKYVSIGAIK